MYFILYSLTLSVCLSTWMFEVSGNKVLLISMDGFRWDYIEQVDTPNFDAFAVNGTRAQYINGSFVTKTFPSHFTMATGLYEESHGIIANSMYDPEFNDYFNKRSKETKWWDGGEPLWVTARKHGLKSAAYFWPGDEAKIKGLRPNIYFKFDGTIPFRSRIDSAVQWLSDDIDLVMVYLSEPDTTGHLFGPNTPQVRSKVKEMDDLLGYIVEEFDKASLWNTVNVIITSDHGMTEVDYANKHVDLSNFIDMNAVDAIPTTGPTANILPRVDMEQEIIDNLTNVPHIKVYSKDDIPEHWHYKEHRRILPVLVVAEEGWVALKGPEEYGEPDLGAHGYDNTLSSMKPIFYARGPNIKRGFKSLPFSIVDIYPLVCKLLCLKPAPNNGTLDNTKYFIVNDNSESCQRVTSSSSTIDLHIFMLAILSLFLISPIRNILYIL